MPQRRRESPKHTFKGHDCRLVAELAVEIATALSAHQAVHSAKPCLPLPALCCRYI